MLGVSQTGWMFVAGLTFLAFFFLIMFMNKYAIVVALGTFPVAPVVGFVIARFTPILRVE
ncbi:MAG: hypothetical protein OXQ29_04560 [Rhodospirillaceae bacterium]|nr:hypothetical protein [Rhodospirillaceae bacterium]